MLVYLRAALQAGQSNAEHETWVSYWGRATYIVLVFNRVIKSRYYDRLHHPTNRYPEKAGRQAGRPAGRPGQSSIWRGQDLIPPPHAVAF